ncbi:RodZ domain-containing protein [Iodobacter fluviatilis]|uniref:Cytoskeleton protein RodZ n=1 Tax=Iodobacter fluviatilis TaxID=537 RepID=A0A377Q7Z5_9NEIS|nr:RodZ domain-containing protein [Iodobacter fluviatilis]TCU89495.1 cytoskeleton protein RodZ [Iodobacter fluviatilis]STQ90865.1 Cytoskeleton protein rodZ [Iodobacter fluviatilis]
MTEIIDSSSAPQSVVHTAGAALKARRLELGYSLDKVSAQLKLTPRQIEAIESERFDELPGNTFVRGFVRNYARFLDLPMAPLLAHLETCLPQERQQAALPRVNEDASVLLGSGAKANTFLLGAVVTIGVAVGAAGVVWYLQQPVQPELLASATASLPKVVVLDEASEVAAQSASQVLSLQASAVLAEPASVASAVAIAKPVASAPVAAPASAVQALVPGELTIAVQLDSWVQVQDSTGAKLVSELLRPGMSRSVSGVPPYRLKIGNAPHTKLTFRNQIVDLTTYTRGDVATFELK